MAAARLILTLGRINCVYEIPIMPVFFILPLTEAVSSSTFLTPISMPTPLTPLSQLTFPVVSNLLSSLL